MVNSNSRTHADIPHSSHANSFSRHFAKKLLALLLVVCLFFSLVISIAASDNIALLDANNTTISPTYQDFKNAENRVWHTAGPNAYYGPFSLGSGSVDYYRINVLEDGAYNIYSDANFKMVGKLYTKTGVYPFGWHPVEYASSVGNEEDKNFRIEYDMKRSGISYWLAVRGVGSEHGTYHFSFRPNLDTAVMTTSPAYMSNGVSLPQMNRGTTWVQNSGYKEYATTSVVENIDRISYYTPEEMKYLYRFCELDALDSLYQQRRYNGTQEAFSTALSALGLIIPDIGDFRINLFYNVLVFGIGNYFSYLERQNPSNPEKKINLLGELRSAGEATLNPDSLLYEFKNGIRFDAYTLSYPSSDFSFTQLIYGCRVAAYNDTIYYGVEGDRGQWKPNDVWPEEIQ